MNHKPEINVVKEKRTEKIPSPVPITPRAAGRGIRNSLELRQKGVAA
jgi:hypothetical protein